MADPLARTSIAGEMKQLQDAIHEISESKRSPISLLPDDVLSHIFLIIADELTLDNMIRLMKDIRSSSQVCCSWRDVALSISRLWRAIYCENSSVEWISTLLERSGSVSLLVNADEYLFKGTPTPGLMLILPQLHRIAKLNVSSTYYVSAGGWEILMSCLMQPAPLLEDLILVVRHTQHAWKLRLPSEGIFHGRAPRLKHLTISNCGIAFEPGIYGSLASLSVSSVIPGEGTPLNSRDWLNTLRLMPLLENLSIHNSVYPTDLQLSEHEDAKLPFLKSLGLKELGLVTCAALLSHLILPPKCSIQISCDDVSLGQDLQLLVQVLFSKISQESSQIVIDSTNHSFSLALSEISWGSGQSKPSILPAGISTFVALNFTHGQDLNSLSEFLMPAMEPYVSRVEVLSFSTKYADTSEQLVHHILRPFNAVQHISVARGQGKGLSEVFSVIADSRSEVEPYPFTSTGALLPKLTRIELHDIQLVVTPETSEPGDKPYPGYVSDRIKAQLAFSIVVSSMKSRAAMGFPIKELEFTKCRGVHERMDVLKELGIHVIWDGTGIALPPRNRRKGRRKT